MAYNYNQPPEFNTDLLATPETAQVRDVREMGIMSANEKMLEALNSIKSPDLIAQSSYYDDLESDWRNGRRYWFRDNGPVTQEMLNMHCAETLAYTGGSSSVGRKLPYTRDGRTPIRCQYNMDYSIGAGNSKVSAGIGGVGTYFKDLLRTTPLCQSNYSINHSSHNNGTRCGIFVRPAGKGVLR